MKRYLERARELAQKFDIIEFMQIPKEANHLADLLSRAATSQSYSLMSYIEERRISEVYTTPLQFSITEMGILG